MSSLCTVAILVRLCRQNQKSTAFVAVYFKVRAFGVTAKIRRKSHEFSIQK